MTLNSDLDLVSAKLSHGFCTPSYLNTHLTKSLMTILPGVKDDTEFKTFNCDLELEPGSIVESRKFHSV